MFSYFEDSVYYYDIYLVENYYKLEAKLNYNAANEIQLWAGKT